MAQQHASRFQPNDVVKDQYGEHHEVVSTNHPIVTVRSLRTGGLTQQYHHTKIRHASPNMNEYRGRNDLDDSYPAAKSIPDVRHQSGGTATTKLADIPGGKRSDSNSVNVYLRHRDGSVTLQNSYAPDKADAAGKPKRPWMDGPNPIKMSPANFMEQRPFEGPTGPPPPPLPGYPGARGAPKTVGKTGPGGHPDSYNLPSTASRHPAHAGLVASGHKYVGSFETPRGIEHMYRHPAKKNAVTVSSGLPASNQMDDAPGGVSSTMKPRSAGTPSMPSVGGAVPGGTSGVKRFAMAPGGVSSPLQVSGLPDATSMYDHHTGAAKRYLDLVKHHISMGKLALSPQDRAKHLQQAKKLKVQADQHIAHAQKHADAHVKSGLPTVGRMGAKFGFAHGTPEHHERKAAYHRQMALRKKYDPALSKQHQDLALHHEGMANAIRRKGPGKLDAAPGKGQHIGASEASTRGRQMRQSLDASAQPPQNRPGLRGQPKPDKDPTYGKKCKDCGWSEETNGQGPSLDEHYEKRHTRKMDASSAEQIYQRRKAQLEKSRQAPDQKPTQPPRGSRSATQRREAQLAYLIKAEKAGGHPMGGYRSAGF